MTAKLLLLCAACIWAASAESGNRALIIAEIIDHSDCTSFNVSGIEVVKAVARLLSSDHILEEVPEEETLMVEYGQMLHWDAGFDVTFVVPPPQLKRTDSDCVFYDQGSTAETHFLLYQSRECSFDLGMPINSFGCFKNKIHRSSLLAGMIAYASMWVHEERFLQAEKKGRTIVKDLEDESGVRIELC